MIRLDKFQQHATPSFTSPLRKQTEIAGRKRVNKLMSKLEGKRNRFLTECVSDVKTRIGFLPTKSSGPTMGSIQRLRDKAAPKPEISQCFNTGVHKQSTDDVSPLQTMSSASSKKVNVVLIKKDQDLDAHNHGVNRLRLQTY